MTVELSGIAGTQARVAQIQAQLAMLTGARPQQAAQTAPAASFQNSLLRATDTANADLGFSSASSTTGTGRTGLTAGGSSVSADALLTAASKYLGVPYKWGGTNPAVGLDCSGFVQRAFADVGIKLPRVAADQARQGTAVPSLAQAKPGDLVAFGSPVDHIGIYVGDNKMIVAPRTGDVVKIQNVYRTPTAIRRILPESAPAFNLAGAAGLGQTLGAGAVSGSALAGAPATYRALFEAAESKYGVKAELLAAVAKQESNFNPSAISSAGALGLMQIMPGTARGLGVNPRIPEQAVDGAARLLKENLAKFGSTQLALAAYNAGAGAVQRYGGIPPYSETQNYVRKIMADPGVRAA